MKILFFIFCTFACLGLSAKVIIPLKPEADSVFVSKSKKQMSLYQNGKLIKTYIISIGDNEKGHKVQQGDDRTPEGLYIINDRNPNSRYYKNLGISYPNASDRAMAAKRKVAVGGDIKIHGYADKYGSSKEKYTRFSSTWGCIGVCNADMNEIYAIVKIGAKIFIAP